MWDVVVVGAGMSGLTAAQDLMAAGYSVQVVDKSRGLGGRMATRRVEGQPVDHGCRFLQPFTHGEGAWWSDALSQGWLQPWTPQAFGLDEGDRIRPRTAIAPYYIAPGGMNTLAKTLAQGLSIQRQCRIMALMPLAQGWQLNAETEAETPTAIMARTVILAMPAPQIHPLLTGAMAVMPCLRSLIEPLDRVVFEAVITVMAGYGAGTNPTLGDSPEAGSAGWMVFGHDRSVLRWAGLDSGKRPQAESPVVVLHSSAAFAEEHLDGADLQPVGQTLLNQVAPSLGPWLAHPAWMQVHRWRYGLVKQPHPTNVLSTSAVPTLVGCGDWCGGVDIEAAIASGHGAAHHIAQWLAANS